MQQVQKDVFNINSQSGKYKRALSKILTFIKY